MSRLSFAGVLNNGKTDFAILGEGRRTGPRSEARHADPDGRGTTVDGGRPLRTDGGRRRRGRLGHPCRQRRDAVAEHTGRRVGTTWSSRSSGTFRTFSKDYDARAVRISLPDAQELMASPAVNSMVVELRDTASTDDAVAETLRARNSTRRSSRSGPGCSSRIFYDKTAALFKRQFAFLQAIILMSGAPGRGEQRQHDDLRAHRGVRDPDGDRHATPADLPSRDPREPDGGPRRQRRGRRALGIVAALVINRLPHRDAAAAEFQQQLLRRRALAAFPILTSFVLGIVATPLTALWPAFRISRVPVVDALRIAGQLTAAALTRSASSGSPS